MTPHQQGDVSRDSASPKTLVCTNFFKMWNRLEVASFHGVFGPFCLCALWIALFSLLRKYARRKRSRLRVVSREISRWDKAGHLCKCLENFPREKYCPRFNHISSVSRGRVQVPSSLTTERLEATCRRIAGWSRVSARRGPAGRVHTLLTAS